MGVFTFVLRTSGGEWNAKQHNGELEASAASAYELQRKLVQTILSSDSSCGVQTSYSAVSPTSAVFQVVVGGVSGGGAFIGGGAAAAAPSSGPGAAAEAPPAEEKKEEEGESDDDLGIDLFD